MNEENVVVDNANTTEEAVLETAEASTEPTETVEESVDDIKARLAKAEELNQSYKIRAEKAERLIKEKKEAVSEAKPVNLNSSDLYALLEAKVSQDNISEVEEYAKYKKISISEALKSSTLKTILAEKDEQRKIASATNIGTSRRGSSKVSDEALISNARSGKLPESDEEINRLIKARMGYKQ